MLKQGDLLLSFLLSSFEVADSLERLMIIFLKCKNIQVAIFSLKRTLLCDSFVLTQLSLLSYSLLLGYVHQIEHNGHNVLVSFRLTFYFELHSIDYSPQKT